LDATTLLDLSELFLTQSNDGGLSLTHAQSDPASAAASAVVNLTQLMDGEQELMLSSKNLINADSGELRLLAGSGSERPDECSEQNEQQQQRHQRHQMEEQESVGSSCSRMMLLEAVDPRLVVLDSPNSQQQQQHQQQRVSVITTRSHFRTNGAAFHFTKRS
jgi:hypothetical protein